MINLRSSFFGKDNNIIAMKSEIICRLQPELSHLKSREAMQMLQLVAVKVQHLEMTYFDKPIQASQPAS